MKNLAQLLQRYEKDLIPELKWGCNPYFKVNNNQDYYLNSRYGGFVLNDEGRVQCYVMNKYNVPKGALEIDFKESHLGTYRWWDETLDKFYPHPWYPEEPIIAFQVVRPCPFFDYKKVYPVKRGGTILHSSYDPDGVIVSEKLDHYKVDHLLEYPEFFKPLYS